jgi:predicted DNA-binding transcriptional regulator YafY
MQPNSSARNGFVRSAPGSGADSPRLRLPLARLLQVVMILQSERFPNVHRLAEACGVSRRTIYRDLTVLETAGLSLVYLPDQQGYELRRDCLLQPPQLEDREALAILIMSRLGSIPDPFGSLLAGRKALSKVIHALPPTLRNRITDMGELLPGHHPVAEIPKARQAIYETILGALMNRQRIRLQYRENAANPISTTIFELYRLVPLQGQWALVGHSAADRGVRLFWLPWIESVRTTGEKYSIHPRFRLDKFLEKLQPPRGDQLTEVQLRFNARVAPLIRDIPSKFGQMMKPAEDGTIELVLTVKTLDEIVHWVLGFGDQVEVIKPEELKNAVCDWADRIIRRYSARPA